MKAGILTGTVIILAGVAVLLLGDGSGSDFAAALLFACGAILIAATVNDGGKPGGGDSW